MKVIKKRKNLSKNVQKHSKTRKNQRKTVKYKRFPKQSFKVIIDRLDKLNKIYPEYILDKNRDVILEAERTVIVKSKERFRAGSDLFVINFARAVLSEYYKGERFNRAIGNQLKTFMLYKKELRILRKAFMFVILSEITEVEETLFKIKRDINAGSRATRLKREPTPAFYFGLTKSPSLGLFLDRKEEIISGIDVLVVDLEFYRWKLSILINLLIKCMS